MKCKVTWKDISTKLDVSSSMHIDLIDMYDKTPEAYIFRKGISYSVDT